MTQPWIWWRLREMMAILILCSVPSVASMLVGGVEWLGSWKMAMDWTAGAVILVGPVVAGLTAWRYSNMTQTGFQDLAGQTLRGSFAWLSPAFVLWLGAFIEILVLAVIATSVTLHYGSVADFSQASILLLAGVVLAAQVAVGAFLGTRFPGPWAPPLSAVLVFGLTTCSSVGLIPETFRPGGITSSLVGQEYRVGVILAESFIAVGLLALLLLVIRSVIVPTASPFMIVFVVLSVSAGAGSWISGAATDGRLRFADTKVVCVGDVPEICMARETSRPLGAVAAAFREISEPLRESGLSLPKRWEQEIPGRRHPDDAGLLLFFDSGETSAGVERSAMLLSVASPADCDEFRAPSPNPDIIDAKATLIRWLDLETRERNSEYLDEKLDPWLSSDAGRDWALRTYVKFTSCDLNDVEIPAPLREED